MILPPLSNITGGKWCPGKRGGGALVQEVGLTSSTQKSLPLPSVGQSSMVSKDHP